MTEEEIMSTWRKEYNNQPVLTIWCTVYNHENFIEQCLDSFLMQETTFPFVVIPHDDASTDSSASILQKYAEKYPNIVKPVLEKNNVYSQGNLAFEELKKRYFKTEYIALCEGDDYWSDPRKLQKQFEFMEIHRDYFSVGHLTKSVDKYGNTVETFIDSKPGDYTVEDNNRWQLYAHVSSYFFRNPYLKMTDEDIKEYAMVSIPGDRKYPILFLQYGKLYVLDEEMSVYRFMSCASSFTSQKHTCAEIYGEFEKLERYANSKGIYVNYKQPKENQLHIAFKNAICHREKSIFYILRQRKHGWVDLFKCVIYYVVKMPVYIKKRINK